MVYARVDIDLNDLADDDLIEHLRSRGYSVAEEGQQLPEDDLARIEHLADLKLTEQARTGALAFVGMAIGRTI